jgi:hypothetical protein
MALTRFIIHDEFAADILLHVAALPKYLLLRQVTCDIQLTGHLGYLHSTSPHHLLDPQELQLDMS